MKNLVLENLTLLILRKFNIVMELESFNGFNKEDNFENFGEFSKFIFIDSTSFQFAFKKLPKDIKKSFYTEFKDFKE